MTESFKKYLAEFIGTFVLVFFSCGTAVFVSYFSVDAAASYLIIALAFGLSVVAMAYAIGHISGCHINPAVSLAMLILKKLSGKDFLGYVVAQVLGGIAGSAILLLITRLTNIGATGLGANGFGIYSAVDLTLVGALIVEVFFTFVFVLTVIGVTSSEKTAPIAGLVIGLVLTFVHFIGIPLTGASVNPARSLAPAVILAFGGHLEALSQVWVFIAAPLVGGALAALVAKYL
ncbi:MAG: aquaporin, partial [Firmicutes bacterium]|nr:aquaporin [Bacillota bacterium]